jgi:ribosomal protein S1
MDTKENKMKSKLEEMAELYPIDSIIQGEVYMLTPFGIFLKIGHPEFMGLIEIVHINDEEGLFDYSLYPALTSKVKVCVIGHRPENNQVYLSMKPSLLREKTR